MKKIICIIAVCLLLFAAPAAVYAADDAVSQNEETVNTGIGAMFITSDNPEEKGRVWVESSPTKSNKATGSMRLEDADGNTIYDGKLTQIKGRGNSTWEAEKKPYQIKLDTKTDLLGIDGSAPSKTWVLLANYYDGSKMRNRLAFDLGRVLGLEQNIDTSFVNLYYDGEYRGLYQLSEKVEVGKERADIHDLEADNEKANPGVENLADLPVSTGKTSNGAEYHYCEGMKSPADITGGYLLELDYPDRAAEEISYFVTKRGQSVTVKAPECCSRNEMDYIASYYQNFEDALFSQRKNSSTGKSAWSYMDIESAARCYLVNELSKNNDGFKSSSYIYKDKGSAKMFMGPLWDYDSGFGLGMSSEGDRTADPTGLYTALSLIGKRMYILPEFRMTAKKIYTEELYPYLKETVLDGTKEGSIEYYEKLLNPSRELDAELWGGNYEEDTASLKKFTEIRAEWLYDTVSKWNEESGERFNDVLPGEWFYESINEAAEKKLVNGDENGFFDPDEITCRMHIAQILYNINDRPEAEYSPVFTDVQEDSWFSDAVLWAYEQGVVKGYPEGIFGAENPVIRQDIAVMLYRSAGSPDSDAEADELNEDVPQAVPEDGDNRVFSKRFKDSLLISDYAADAVEWAVENGILTGYEDESIRPVSKATRAEMTVMLLRFSKLNKD